MTDDVKRLWNDAAAATSVAGKLLLSMKVGVRR